MGRPIRCIRLTAIRSHSLLLGILALAILGVLSEVFQAMLLVSVLLPCPWFGIIRALEAIAQVPLQGLWPEGAAASRNLGASQFR